MRFVGRAIGNLRTVLLAYQSEAYWPGGSHSFTESGGMVRVIMEKKLEWIRR